ncbi:MAG: DUF4097 family beta strand repeat-containing protein [Acidobacteriota bacterium]|nr:DUF4097 family beta strand repeat-containing protein [Acidobacteriota bacterium]
MKFTLSLMCLAALPLAAQDKQLNCDDHSFGGSRAHFCEIREQTIPSTGRLTVDGRVNGGVSVKGWDRADVLVRSQVQSQGDNDGDAKAIAAQVLVHAAGGQVAADGPSGKSWGVSYEVFVPMQTDLNLTAQNGGIRIDHVHGNIEFSTHNGGVHLTQVAGNVKGQTQNGGVHVELAGNRWDGAGLDVKTQNGGVHVAMPAGYSAHLDASTVNGVVHSDFAELVSEKTGGKRQRQVSKDLNGGGAPLRLTTVNGGVHLQKS